MAKSTLERLEAYKNKHELTDKSLSDQLKIPYNYLFRWRKAGRIIGIYKRFIEDFLEKSS